MAIDEARWEIVRGFEEDASFVELWDRLLAPAGLALEVIQPSEGQRRVAGHGVMVPADVAVEFLTQAEHYLSSREAG